MYLRNYNSEDCELLYRWINDPTVRINAFNTSPISFGDHVAWFNNCLNSKEKFIFICMDGTKPVGEIRIELKDNLATISYVVDKIERGRGIGTKMLDMVYDIVKNYYPQISFLRGFVKKDNIASRKAFLKNKYSELEERDYFLYTIAISR